MKEPIDSSLSRGFLNTLMSAAFSEDITLKAYENTDHSFLLARTLRAGTLNGVETELAYFENAPGYIFINPTTLISKKIPSKTIAQLPGNDWSDHPTLLVSVQTQKKATIAPHGLFSVNSFSSTDALSLLTRLVRLEGQTSKKLSFAKKMADLATFLQVNWENTISSVEKEVSVKAGKTLVSPAIKDLRKKFYKPYNLYFHNKPDYSSLLFSFDEFIAQLDRSNQLENPTLNISLSPHPLARIMEQHLQQRGMPSKTVFNKMLLNELQTELQNDLSYPTKEKKKQAEINRINKLKGLFFCAEGSLSKSSRQVINYEEFGGKSIYERYCDYFDTGARHNELASRVYPWEITGMEWGSSDACRINAVANTIIITERKKSLLQELDEQGVKHPLFIDFMLNKLSIENPTLDYNELNNLYQQRQKENLDYLAEILTEIKLQCLNPVCIYEYSPTKKELTNITALVAKPQQALLPVKRNSIWKEVNRQAESNNVEKFRKIYQAGISAYSEWLKCTTVIPPLSGIKKLNVRIKNLKLTQWAKFWERDCLDKNFKELLQYLSDNVINQPYLDEKREITDTNGFIVYRPNHDVTHSSRKLSYKDYIIRALLGSTLECYQKSLKELTPEENACLNLLIFLYRSGRTNELGSAVDASNAERSANLFAMVTLQLGFNAELVASMKMCFSYLSIGTSIDSYFSEGYTGDANVKKYKAFLVYRIANISHDLDLVRCNSWRYFFETEDVYLKAKSLDPSIKNFQFDIIKQMKIFFPNDREAQAITNKLLILAKKSCEASGTPVFYEGFSSSEKVSDYNEPIKDPILINLFKDKFDPKLPLIDIKSYWTENVAQCLDALHEVAENLEGERNYSYASNFSM
ncbi:Uncharacterised protein [Legionella beliardensis]|uniref:SidE PDE domain-containing protein n=1 Tax=Legionella beliardensis TaxID=91822 RepID=A0A378I5F3_9GAMM|nr:SidE phosphodiesterase domain-containing protein [Legionella beliardensis]STX29946.1 Uncharacterised protein [Legionella beliardensis]